ncbi:glycerol kinase GlpK [Kiloniella laminariae]|uniref:Glycerol kinase n=1 Tax=Kiloniella laminariae TaxID=454162 RepID=A0ABT4LKB8_9PROT|nr:glycerol kinase GlpK [Kiloniella laminariae]MCZ4281522.1 glycerol kinase GlpK [Kiloniella laminariae]
MSDKKYILSIDQGTTSSRAIVFDTNGISLTKAQQEFPQIYPNDGWVEHDPETIWSSTLAVSREALREANAKGAEVVTIGITNQRETTIVWDRVTGKPVYNAIVWQDRRTADFCSELKAAGHEELVTARTGLLLDPYFSATKVAWILDNVEGARTRAEKGELAFGTVDSFLLWHLTGGKVHATDVTNASRTMIFDIHKLTWDKELLALFNIPASVLPEVKDSAASFGQTAPEVFGYPIPVEGIAGDQQAASFGQTCFEPGAIKSTYGTGCFVLLNTGDKPLASKNRLLTTIGYRVKGQTSYALEGAIFVSGAAVQWLRDGLKIIQSASETEALASSLSDNKGVYLVPAFTGLGAPYWDPHARGAIFGLTRDSGPAEIVRATLEAVCYQTRDLFQAMADDGLTPKELRVDGGMVTNDWLLQFLADTLDLSVDRPEVSETTALGAAYLAGLQHGIYKSLEDIRQNWHLQKRFTPDMPAAVRDHNLAGWDLAIQRTRQK